MKFKVGDRARVVDAAAKPYEEYIGEEVVIDCIGEFEGALTGDLYTYSVRRLSDPMLRYFCNDEHLEPVNKPKVEVSTWEEVKDCSGWNPTKLVDGERKEK